MFNQKAGQVFRVRQLGALLSSVRCGFILRCASATCAGEFLPADERRWQLPGTEEAAPGPLARERMRVSTWQLLEGEPESDGEDDEDAIQGLDGLSVGDTTGRNKCAHFN